MPFGPASVYRDLIDRPVDLLDGEAERQQSAPGRESQAWRSSSGPGQPSTSGAEAATERSEGVAGAKRQRSPDNSPEGRALDTSGSESWAMPGGSPDISLLNHYVFSYTLIHFHGAWYHYITSQDPVVYGDNTDAQPNNL